MDDYIRQRPENIPRGRRGKFTMDSYYNYPLGTRQALDYVRDQGIPYKRYYRYTGTRDRSPKGPKEVRSLQFYYYVSGTDDSVLFDIFIE